jgi:CBS domain-containing protein
MEALPLMDVINVARIPAHVAPPNATVFHAISLMAEKNVGAVVVTDPNSKVVGIFTERDALLKVAAKRRDADRTLLTDVMTSPVETAQSDSSVEEALARMIKGHFRHLPIVDGENRVVGIVSIRHLLMREIGTKDASLEVLEALLSAGGPG